MIVIDDIAIAWAGIAFIGYIYEPIVIGSFVVYNMMFGEKK